LQDPRAGEEAPVPALRLSLELGPSSESGLDRDTAQQTWEALQLKTEDVMAQRVQLREANAKAEAATKLAQAARTEVTQLKAKVQELQDTRWQHPAVYGAGIALAGLSCLWLFERKRRIAVQEHAALLLNEAHSVLSIPAGPSLSPMEPIHALPSETAQLVEDVLPPETLSPPETALLSEAAQPAEDKLQHSPVADSVKDSIIQDPIAEFISQEDLLPYRPPQAAPVVFQKKPSLWKRLFSKPQKAVFANSRAQSHLGHHSSLSTAPSTEIDLDLYEANTELEDMQAPDEDLHDSVLATVELLTQTRIKPASSDDALGHLLEMRMAVQALMDLQRPHAAQLLLQQHIDAVPNTCAWAYMEYLDLCSKLGQRDAFEAMRKRYRLQFNRLAPYWMEPNASVQSLDSYERPMAELCAVWDSLERSKVLMATWLLGTLHSRRLFQLPAYHDLLDLYEMLEFYDDQVPSPQDFLPTVSLLELDYEFAIEVKLEAQSDDNALRAVPTVKTGDFAVDFNLTQGNTELGALTKIPEPSGPR
jgi:hypothetical protein